MRRGKDASLKALISAMAEAESKSYYEEQENALNDLSGLLKTFLNRDDSPERVRIRKDYEAGAALTGKGGIRQRLGAVDMEFFGRAYFPHYFSRPSPEFHRELDAIWQDGVLKGLTPSTSGLVKQISRMNGCKRVVAAPRGHAKSTRASAESLTEKDIREIIDENLMDLKYGMLTDYYVGQHRILSETKKDSTAPNNRLVNNMAKYITDTATSYFVGQPVVYNSQDDAYLQTVQDIFDYNDEQDHNMELAKQCSICGSCFEMLYLDEDAQIRFAKVAPSDLIMIYESDSGHAQPMAAIRSVRSVDKDKNVILKVEFWNAYQVLRFRSFNNGYLNLEAIEDHYWQDVPFVEYINNEERRGDFEGVITEIDAYNKAQSNTANYFQYNDDAILKILKLGDVSSDDVRDMKEKGAIILDDGGDVQWLLKQVDDTAMENFKNRLREDIHTMSHVPHLCDESFGGNLSGVAIAYKLWGLEQLCAMKERKFKKGLQRRIELITNILNIKGGHYDYKDITPKFRRNKPENNLELTQIATQLSGLLSTESRLQMLPWVENVHDEMEKLEEEKTKDVDEFGTYENFAKAFESQQNGMTAEAAAEGVDESERTE